MAQAVIVHTVVGEVCSVATSVGSDRCVDMCIHMTKTYLSFSMDCTMCACSMPGLMWYNTHQRSTMLVSLHGICTGGPP